jgi:hypothetical protein
MGGGGGGYSAPAQPAWSPPAQPSYSPPPQPPPQQAAGGGDLKYLPGGGIDQNDPGNIAAYYRLMGGGGGYSPQPAAPAAPSGGGQSQADLVAIYNRLMPGGRPAGLPQTYSPTGVVGFAPEQWQALLPQIAQQQAAGMPLPSWATDALSQDTSGSQFFGGGSPPSGQGFPTERFQPFQSPSYAPPFGTRFGSPQAEIGAPGTYDPFLYGGGGGAGGYPSGFGTGTIGQPGSGIDGWGVGAGQLPGYASGGFGGFLSYPGSDIMGGTGFESPFSGSYGGY